MSMEDEPCPYSVLAPIGEGASGVTYLAQPLTGPGGFVALKILRPRDDVDAVLSRYHYWKTALAKVQHPSAGRLLGIGPTADGLLYVASEYVAGWPLTILGSHATVKMDQRVEIASQLTGAIESAHAVGVVHLGLDASKIKISTANGPHATILGLGSSLIVDGAEGSPEVDRRALAAIVRELVAEP
jgi:serine/threonine-protein kinase